jgi:5-methyltetrahydropteroyltriglutamate--homocysteine methyltransferase
VHHGADGGDPASATLRGDRRQAIRYAFPPQLADSIAQISRSAQPKIDLGVLKDLAPKKVMLGVIDPTIPRSRRRKRSPTASARLKFMVPDKLLPGPIGMKYRRGRRRSKLKSLAEGAAIVRKELG